MTGNAYSVDIRVDRGGRPLVFMTGFKVKGIDVTHASLHVEINQLLGRFFEGARELFSPAHRIGCLTIRQESFRLQVQGSGGG